MAGSQPDVLGLLGRGEHLVKGHGFGLITLRQQSFSADQAGVQEHGAKGQGYLSPEALQRRTASEVPISPSAATAAAPICGSGSLVAAVSAAMLLGSQRRPRERITPTLSRPFSFGRLSRRAWIASAQGIRSRAKRARCDRAPSVRNSARTETDAAVPITLSCRHRYSRATWEMGCFSAPHRRRSSSARAAALVPQAATASSMGSNTARPEP